MNFVKNLMIAALGTLCATVAYAGEPAEPLEIEVRLREGVC